MISCFSTSWRLSCQVIVQLESGLQRSVSGLLESVTEDCRISLNMQHLVAFGSVERISGYQISDFRIQPRCNHAPKVVPIAGDSTALNGTQLDSDPCSLQGGKTPSVRSMSFPAGIGL